VLRLIGSDVRDRGENICTVSSGSLDAVAVIDASLSCLVIDIKILKVVVEINAPGTKIATEKGRVSSKDCCDIDVPLAA
jgi:hypothetical protein